MNGAILTDGPYREGRGVWCLRDDGTRYLGVVGMVRGNDVYVIDKAALERFEFQPCVMTDIRPTFTDDETWPIRLTFPWRR